MKLNEDQVRDRLALLGGWELRDEAIACTYKLSNFKEAMAFVNKVAEAAEEMDHHPDILISYNVVQLSVFTHSEGGLTEKDFTLAGKVNTIAD